MSIKLTTDIMLKIVQLRGCGLSYRDISKHTNVPKSTIGDFLSKLTHKGKGRDISSLNGTKKILVVGDLHSGSQCGLTPPNWMPNPGFRKVERKRLEKLWEFYTSTINKIGDVDTVFCLADCIDGKGNKNSGVELITSDLIEQSEIAIAALSEIKHKKMYMVYGTSFHTANNGDDIEKIIANRMSATIGDYVNVNVNGMVFNLRHKIGSSSILASRVSPLIKEYQWSAENTNEITPDVFLRGHCHYNVSTLFPDKFLAMTAPSLQLPFSQYGNRICTGQVDVGMVYMEVPKDCKNVQDIFWKSYLLNTKNMEEVF